jgi:DNA-binding CsgD family transcriptional regulator
MELTRRELDVLKFLASGYTNEQTANILGVTYRTIAVHLESIWRKLDVESRPATVTSAVESRVLDRSPVRI